MALSRKNAISSLQEYRVVDFKGLNRGQAYTVYRHLDEILNLKDEDATPASYHPESKSMWWKNRLGIVKE